MAKDQFSDDYKIQLRNLTIDDFEDIKASMNNAYVNIGGLWKREQIARLLELFPEGQIGIEVEGKIVSCALSIIVDYKKFGDKHTYEQITGKYSFNTHNPDGDVLYGIEVFVDPNYQGMRLGRRLYDARKDLCENLNLRAIIAGGRIPGYKNYAEKLTPKQYIQGVEKREIYDPILTFQISNGLHVKKILTNYLSYDTESMSYATLIEWHNVYYEEKEQLIGSNKSVVRIGIAQWQMRNVTGLDHLLEQVEFFIDAVSGYKSDFILFPELFNAPLMEEFNNQTEGDAIRSLAGFTETLREKFVQLAMAYNINIITGSMPYLEGSKLYNVAYLCRRDGSWDSQYKIHITPNERHYWGMVGGNELKTFDTDCGKIGILICYDSEFPELSRFLAKDGMDILFVPFLTDTVTGYNRVRCCAAARAVENECYVAIGGSVGNLPKVSNMDIQYAQSAVFSPSDFSFPKDAIVTEATANTEMTLIADVNLDLLKELHTKGSVQNLKDIRNDLFELVWKGK